MGFRVHGEGLGLIVQGPVAFWGIMVYGFGFGVQGMRFNVQGLGLRGWVFFWVKEFDSFEQKKLFGLRVWILFQDVFSQITGLVFEGYGIPARLSSVPSRETCGWCKCRLSSV